MGIGSVVGRGGFSLVELVSVVAMVAAVGAVLGPSVGGMRSQMRSVSSEGNLSAIGQVAGMYGADNQGAIFTFTWQPDVPYLNLRNGKMVSADNEMLAGAFQVRDILHRATGRLNGPDRIVPSIQRVMQRRYSHLVLADYMGGNVSSALWADPADGQQLDWQANPLGYLNDPSSVPYGEDYPSSGSGYDMSANWDHPGMRMLWSFGSSYSVVPAGYLPDDRLSYGPLTSTPHLFENQSVGSQDLVVQRSMHEVAAPYGKVLMYEEFDREQEGSPYFAYDHARPAKLMFDGSINTSESGKARSSLSPEFFLEFVDRPSLYKKAFYNEWVQEYVPIHLFPRELEQDLDDGETGELNMRYRWTGGGLGGLDYQPLLRR